MVVRSPIRAVTLAEVARTAGVSTATVSNAVNGRPGMRGETRDKVMAVVTELNYQGNPTARNLRSGTSQTVALLAPQLDKPYFGQLATWLADGLEATGRHLVVQRTSIRRAGELSAAAFARLRLYDAVVIALVDTDPQEVERLNFAVPVVLLGERAGPSGLDQVRMDNVGGARAATTHLFACGARRIALLGGHRGADAGDMCAQRTRGWREAHRARGAAPDPELILPLEELDLSSSRRAVMELAASGVPFDGIFALTDVVAAGALRALDDLGLAVPRDVQVVGFDDVEEASYTVPSLTTVDPGRAQMAGVVLELLDLRMCEHATGVPSLDRRPPVDFVSRGRLVTRQSTRRPDDSAAW